MEQSKKKRGRILPLAAAAVAALVILGLLATDAIPWRRGPLADIYNYDSYELSSLYVYSRRDGDILHTTDEADLRQIRDTLMDLDWRPVWLSKSGGDAVSPSEALQVYACYRDPGGGEKSIWLMCTGSDTITVRSADVPSYRNANIDYQVRGGYDISWIYQ